MSYIAQFITIEGLRWALWTSSGTEELRNAYKRAGVRLRLKDASLFIHPDDAARARLVDELIAKTVK